MNKKKILSMLLSLTMLGSVVCIPVYAENDNSSIDTEQVDVVDTVSAEETPTDENNYDAEIKLFSEETTTYPIEKGQTFSFENIGVISYDITGLSNYIDYVVYYKDGSVSDYNWGQRPNKLSIPSGGKAVITSTDRTVNAVCADEYFFIEEQENPAMNKVTSEIYETYTFKNTSNVSYDLLMSYNSSGSYYFDYILYTADGNVSSYQYNARTNSIEIPAGYSIKVTPTKYPMTFNGIYEKFNLVKNDTPAMKKAIVSVGETYTYTNTDNVAYNLLMTYMTSTSYYFDYVLYTADGDVSSYQYNARTNSIEIPAGYSIKVTPTKYPMTFNGIYEKFNLVKNDTPVMKKAIVSAGETYTYTNTDNVTYNLLMTYMTSTSYYFDYVLYTADGDVSSYQYNTRTNSIEIPAGYSIKVTPTNYTMTFNGIYEKFDLIKNDTPVMKKSIVSAGETYTYTNTSSVAYHLLMSYSSTSPYYFDYVIYYSNGAVKGTVSKARTSSVEIPAGGKIKVMPTSRTTTFNGIYEIFDVADTTAEWQSYKIINTDTVDSDLQIKNGYSTDYAVYAADNTLSNYGVSTRDKITIPKGGYAIVTPNTSSNTPFEENAVLATTDRINPVYKTTYLNPDETYKYTNTAKRELKVFKNGLACDYVIYNADGSISSYEVNSTNEDFTVPIGGSICISSHVYLNIKGLYDYFTVEKVDKSVFDIAFCSLGETYQFTNNAVKDINLIVSSSIYDYVIYNADGSLSDVKMNANNDRVTVPSGSKCAITPQVSNISIYSLNDAFAYSKRSYPVLKRVPVYFGDSVIISNMSSEDRMLYSSTSSYIDYATYDAGNNPQKAEELVTPSTINVPANGKAEITARASNAVFGGLYEAFSDEDFSVKVTGVSLSQNELTLAKGKQSILRATVLPSDATNKNITWTSSNTSVATVAQTGKVTAKSAGTATITVKTADGGYTATCTITVTDGSTPIVTPVPVGDGPKVKVSTATASAGGTATVTIDLSDNKGFANLGLDITYDKNVLTLTSANNNASVGAVYTPSQNITANPYHVGWDSTGNVTFNGTLVTLTFAVNSSAADGEYPITVSYYKGNNGNYTDGADVNYDENFNSIKLNYINGAVKVSSHIPGDINGDGKVNNQDGTFLLRHLAGWNVNVDNSALDVNGDGKVNNQDGTVLLRHLAGWNITIY